MLLRFAVQNHRSIAAPIELSMVAVDQERSAAHYVENIDESVLTVAGIYGANASGKTNVLQAISWLVNAVRTSVRSWDGSVPREPFAFGSWVSEPTVFEIDLLVENVRYTYLMECSDSSVEFEGLYSYPQRKKRTLIERDGRELSFRRGLPGIKGTRELLTPTTLAISAAMRYSDTEVQVFGSALGRISPLRQTARSYRSGARGPGRLMGIETERIFYESSDADVDQPQLFPTPRSELRESALELLRFADLGISDVQVIQAEMEGSTYRSLRLIHEAAEEQRPFEIQKESDGTVMWFRLIGPILRALRTGRTLLIDEMDASLHPSLSAKIVELFQNPVSNPRGAQLLFTSHDASLLSVLNRDEVWLTEKNLGATHLRALAEFRIEQDKDSLDLKGAYLQGRFGGIPDLESRHLRNALAHGVLPDNSPRLDSERIQVGIEADPDDDNT